MDRFEQQHIYQNPMLQHTAIYVRYIDDTDTLANNRAEAEKMLIYLNTQHPTIKFELDTPQVDRFLRILDVEFKIEEDGTIKRQLYTKPANKGISLHAHSHHPVSMKKAMTKMNLIAPDLSAPRIIVQRARTKS